MISHSTRKRYLTDALFHQISKTIAIIMIQYGYRNHDFQEALQVAQELLEENAYGEQRKRENRDQL